MDEFRREWEEALVGVLVVVFPLCKNLWGCGMTFQKLISFQIFLPKTPNKPKTTNKHHEHKWKPLQQRTIKNFKNDLAHPIKRPSKNPHSNKKSKNPAQVKKYDYPHPIMDSHKNTRSGIRMRNN